MGRSNRKLTLKVWIILLAIGVMIPVLFTVQAEVPSSQVSSSQSSSPGEFQVQIPTPTGRWPMERWPVTAPEEQGMNSQLLVNMFTYITENQKNIHSLLIVRNGHLVLEAYFEPYRADIRHHMASATKSVMSMLIGIAIRDDLIESVDQKLIEFFPELGASNEDPRKKEITLEHLLTMTTGIRWHESDRSYWSKGNSLVKMLKETNRVQFVLDQPMETEPGKKYNYNSGATYLLSAIIQKVSGVNAAKYAEENLFNPLGIEEYYWDADSSGITVAHCCLQLTPRDMAKLGYLYLQNGNWEGKQIIPADWVAESVQKRFDALPTSDTRSKITRFFYSMLRRRPPTIQYGYGYQWWVPSFGGYAARGYGGQGIFVIPDLQLVVVFTGGLPVSDGTLMEDLIQRYIIPAAVTSEPLLKNEPALNTLNARLKEYSQPKAEVTAPQPPLAAQVSGKKYSMNSRSAAFQVVSFTFSDDSQAHLKITQNNQTQDLLVGLDEVFRINRIGDQGSLALRGRWIDEDTFVVDWLTVETGMKYEISFTFIGNDIKIVMRGTLDGTLVRMTGRMEE